MALWNTTLLVAHLRFDDALLKPRDSGEVSETQFNESPRIPLHLIEWIQQSNLMSQSIDFPIVADVQIVMEII